jgi:hypothetical protein
VPPASETLICQFEIKNSPMSSSPENDRLLQAQRYLLGEGTTGELAAFETQLAGDPLLAEALADVVLMHEALTGVAPRQATVIVAPRRESVAAQVGIALAALVAVVVVAVAAIGPTGSQKPQLAFDRPEVLETLWSDENPDDADESAEFEMTEASDLEVPDWMVAAVEASSSPTDDSGAPREEEL